MPRVGTKGNAGMLSRRLAAYPLVRVRARLMAENEQCAVLGFPGHEGALQQVTVDYAELGMRNDAAAICDASRELMRKIEGLVDIGLRVQAEAFELGEKMPPWNWWLRPVS
jgi:hypothetical protein